MKLKKILTATAVFALAGTAVAAPALAYTLDDTTGIGHVGKGEVQSVFNWNNKKVQDAYVSPGIFFQVTEFERWTQDCVSKKRTVVLADERERVRARTSTGVDAQNNQITSGNLGELSGWALTGFGDTIREHSGWGTNPWADATNSGCPAGTHPNGGPTRTTWNGPLTVVSGTRSAALTPS